MTANKAEDPRAQIALQVWYQPLDKVRNGITTPVLEQVRSECSQKLLAQTKAQLELTVEMPWSNYYNTLLVEHVSTIIWNHVCHNLNSRAL